MGIRITRRLGWALTDVQHDNGRLIDPRICADSPLLGGVQEPPLAEYKRWLLQHGSPDNMLDRWYVQDLRSVPRAERLKPVSDCVVHRAEYGLPNVLLVRPVACADWSRYGDAIDHTTEWMYQRDRMFENHVQLLPTGIYPFVTWMDARDGRRVRDEGPWRLLSQAGDVDEEMLRVAAHAAGFASAQDARDFLVPEVPHEVRDLCRFGGLLRDEDAWTQMRPVLYTHWS